jgi:hypothetical protein
MKNKELENLLSKQHFHKFSGNINAADKKSGQLLGRIRFYNGQLYSVEYQGRAGEVAFIDLYLDGTDKDFRYINEPELPDKKRVNVEVKIDYLIKQARGFLKKFRDYQEEVPPGHLKFALQNVTDSSKFIDAEKWFISSIEKYQKVERIYQHSPFPRVETTYHLTNLRKKNNIKVIAIQER